MHEVVERLLRELTEGIRGLSAEATQVRPAAGKWSVQQVVEHLVLSYGTTCAVVEARLEKGTPTKATPTSMQRLGQFAITTLAIFPRGRKAPPAVRPADVALRKLSGEELGAQVKEALVRMDFLLARAQASFGRTRGISHVVLGPMSAQQWRRFHLVHGEHHLKQIAMVRRHLPDDRT